MQMLAYPIVCGMLGLLLIQGRGVGAQAPECSNQCLNLPSVSQEIIQKTTDEGTTCELHPDYRKCILEKCQTSTLPAAFVQSLKDNYGCDLSSASPLHLPVLTAMLSLVVAALLFKS